MSKELNEMKMLAGLTESVAPAKQKLDESVMGGITEIPKTASYREQTELDKWMSIVSEAEIGDRAAPEPMPAVEFSPEMIDRINRATYTADDDHYHIDAVGDDYHEDMYTKGEDHARALLSQVDPNSTLARSLQQHIDDGGFEPWDPAMESNEPDNAESLTESCKVAGDYSNGYGNDHYACGNDYFPSGATSPATKHAGPASAKQGDNPMQKDTFEDKEALAESIHSELVYAYRTFTADK